MKRTKWVALLLVVLFVFSVALSGCAPKTQSKVIKIGLIVPLTGDVATFGTSIQNAFNLALKENGPTVAGYTIQTVVADDQNTATQATAVATKLCTQDKVSVIVGSATSLTTIPISVVCEQYKVPFVTPTATNSKVTVDNGVRKTYAFRACFIDPFQGTAGATFDYNNLHAKTAAAMYDQGNDYSVGLKDSFEQAFTKLGGKIVDTMAYTKNDTDFSADLTKIAAEKPDILYLPDYYQKVSLIGSQARNLGIKAVFMGGDGWDSSDLNFAAMNGGYFTNHYSSDDPSPNVQKFVSDYKAAYGSVPDALATLGYDATLIALKGITDAQSTDPTKIRDAIQNISGFQGVTAKFSFGQDGNPIKPAVVLQINGPAKKYNFMAEIQPS
jgi:branched-chain amino acid transport system substrate-binding protein